ncbi:MAG: UDP-N-acetylmuramoyl-tripeptide--D-alanyl-D-alanine ligase [Gammaproteobacteria bacterium]|nr:UDP-N-acetylmuramoyl-tripeptide--D-alanyl-D-alanine ligase [Gammaproteobacteria bacterium]MDH3577068.1 UDP-N-acetylmuramoyl-tripeptide--D-alanyl-D-alanine ligase [Gammaproteobacteria bacterium]
MIASLSAAAKSMSGVLQGEDRAFAGISTDTRTLRGNELFFALEGPNFDGGDYLGTAQATGAAGAVVSRFVDESIAQIKVEDTRRALGSFGAAWRKQHDVTVIGITGSNGKTTLKELVKACLSQQAPTLATQGNLNNDIGMPLMLARIEDKHRFAVFEMGANHSGEIAYLTALANPDVVVITNAAAAHLEGFGSIDGVARAKGEILQNPERPKIAILNADDAYFDYWSALVEDVRMLSFGRSSSADVYADAIVAGIEESQFRLHLPSEEVDVCLPLAGVHNIRNACAAAAVAWSLGIDATQIKRALEGVSPVSGRLQALQGTNGATLFDDSYNANPLSVIAAAEFLSQLSGENWLVLGDMKELGPDAAALHREVGEAARACGIDRLFALGDLSRNTVEGFGEHASWYGSIDALVDELSQELSNSVNVLVKGSRSMHMERVVDALREVEPVRREA